MKKHILLVSLSVLVIGIFSCNKNTKEGINVLEESTYILPEDRVFRFFSKPIINQDSPWDKLSKEQIEKLIGKIIRVDEEDGVQYYSSIGKIKTVVSDGNIIAFEIIIKPNGFKKLSEKIREDTTIDDLVTIFGNYTNSMSQNGGPIKQSDKIWNEYYWQIPNEMKGFSVKIRNNKIIEISFGRDLQD